MAEKPMEIGEDGAEIVADTDTEVTSVKQTSKRCSSGSPGVPAPPHKSPRTDLSSPSTVAADAGEGHSEKQENHKENTQGSSRPTVSPSARRKSWRRDTKSRRSLPALQNPRQVLCRSIDPSLSQQERLEKLFEASVKRAIERIQNSLQSVPNSSLESFQKQVEQMQKECVCLATDIRCEPERHPLPAKAASNPAMQGAMEKLQKAINRLQAESESWEALLNKHRKKSEELERKVEQGQESGILLDSTSAARSSQYLFIQNKPDYRDLLCRQQPMFHTMAMIMDTQCKMVRELLSIKEESQLMVKETSGRLAAEAGFQDLSPDVAKILMTPALSSAAT